MEPRNIVIAHLPNKIVLDEHLILCTVNIGRFEEFKTGIVKDLAHMKQWLPWVEEDVESSSREFYESSERKKEEDKEANWNILVDDKLAGTISFMKRDPNGDYLEIGYWLFSRFNGNGIMTRCAKALVDLAFEQTDAAGVEICCDKANIPSASVAIRAGLKLDHEDERKDSGLAAESGIAQHYRLTREEWATNRALDL